MRTKTKTIPVSPETKERIKKLSEGRENWDDTLNRVLAVYGATAGAIPASEENMEFFSDEHRAGKNTDASATLRDLFTELQGLRENALKRRFKEEEP